LTAVVKPVIWTRYKLGLGVSSQLAELHKPIRHNFKKRRVFVFNIDDIWSADLKDMQSLAKHNKHYKYISTVLQPFNGLFSRTTWVSRYQKGKTNLDFTGARDSEWQWHQLGHMQVCTSLQTDNHANTPPLVFYRPDALPAAQPTASKH